MVPITVSLLFLLLVSTISADPDALQDFCVADTNVSTTFMNGLPCINPTQVSPKHFTTSVLGKAGNTSGNPSGASLIVGGADEMPGINTLGLIMARVDLAVGGVLPVHFHPRASEMVFVLRGKLNAGFVDTANKLFSTKIMAGDVFLFPKGTLHFLQNVGKKPASVIAALNSQAPGVSVVSLATFASSPAVPRDVLATSFQISVEEADKMRRNLGGS